MAGIDSTPEFVLLYDIPETAVDEWGQPSLATVFIGRFWAVVNSLLTKDRERLNVRQQWPIATHQVKMQWLGSAIPATSSNPNREIRPNMQLVCEMDGKRLNIINAVNVQRQNLNWELTCEEHVGATT